jgi:hypothetical protein
MAFFNHSNQRGEYYRTALLCGNILAALMYLHSTGRAESKMTGAEITAYLSDARLSARDAGGRLNEQVFQRSGATFTVDVATHQQSQGFWKVVDNQYCSVWPPSDYWTCYDVVRIEGGVDFVSSGGQHTPMTKTP